MTGVEVPAWPSLATGDPIVDEYVVLLGRPPIGNYLRFVRSLAVNGHAADQADLTAEWRRANDHVRALEAKEVGIADNPPIGALPPDLEPLAAEVFRDPVLQQAFRLVPARLALVDLDRLVVFQRHINLEYVEQLKARLGDRPTVEGVFRLALSLDRTEPPVHRMQGPGTTFSFLCPSNDFRLLEPALLEPNQVQGLFSTGRPSGVIGLPVGFGSNCLNALAIEERLILNNGSHRAYALRDLGLTEVPCLVQSLSTRDELELVASGEFRQSPNRFLRTPRPPLLRDYFDPRLRKLVRVQRKNRLVRVQVTVEQIDLPAD